MEVITTDVQKSERDCPDSNSSKGKVAGWLLAPRCDFSGGLHFVLSRGKCIRSFSSQQSSQHSFLTTSSIHINSSLPHLHLHLPLHSRSLETFTKNSIVSPRYLLINCRCPLVGISAFCPRKSRGFEILWGRGKASGVGTRWGS